MGLVSKDIHHVQRKVWVWHLSRYTMYRGRCGFGISVGTACTEEGVGFGISVGTACTEEGVGFGISDGTACTEEGVVFGI